MGTYCEQIKEFFRTNPSCAGLIPIIFGAIIIIGAVCNWNWVLEGDGSDFNLAWLSNLKGRTYARVVCGLFGLLLIILGLIWIFV